VAPALQRHVTDVTPEWLGAVLGEAGALKPSAVVREVVRQSVGTGQMADTVRFSLTYDEPGAGPSSVVGKFASVDEQSRGTGLALRAYEIEVRFYQQVAPQIGARVPDLFYAEVEPETGWFTLLLEDIEGATQGDQIAGCSPEVAVAVLEEMAGLHAPCWESPRLADMEWLNRNTADSDLFLVAMVNSLLPGFLERYDGQLAPEHAALCQRFCAHLSDWTALRQGPRTANHGDFRLDNLLLAPGARPVVVDWQTVSWSPGAHDVAYFVGGCLTPEVRRAHEEELLSTYHDALCSRGVTGYDLEALRADYRRDTFGGVLMAIVASMIVQRTERGDEMFLTSTTRHAQHALDLEAERVWASS
jgi:hypothetical protein